MSVKANFSNDAPIYKAYRPEYPDALFSYLASLASSHELAWDCGTGNGQAALGLISRFRSVIATDASHTQIAEALRNPQVQYVIALAERTPLPGKSVDLVTVASAAHWLEHDPFFAEVKRVVRPGGVIACWTYHLQTVNPGVDEVVQRLYTDVLGPYWDANVRYMEDGYTSLPFPFDEIAPPRFQLVQKWDLGRLANFLGTWSGSCAYRKMNNREPVDEVREDLAAAWGDPQQQRDVTWNLYMRVGTVAG
jgi:SAM-dependent methyltransferase